MSEKEYREMFDEQMKDLLDTYITESLVDLIVRIVKYGNKSANIQDTSYGAKATMFQVRMKVSKLMKNFVDMYLKTGVTQPMVADGFIVNIEPDEEKLTLALMPLIFTSVKVVEKKSKAKKSLTKKKKRV
jgi:hypothetical protein